MPTLMFADNFLAGSILSLLMPTLLLSAIAVWYVMAVKRVPKDTPTSSTTLPSPEVLAATEDADIVPPPESPAAGS
ncbi:MAG: hypothetical protein WBQ18_13440 [Solirubrobacteraceae bacterium]